MGIGAGSESNLGKGGLLGSDAARRSAGSESKLGNVGFERAGFKRAGQEILEQFQQQLHQQNSARGDRIARSPSTTTTGPIPAWRAGWRDPHTGAGAAGAHRVRGRVVYPAGGGAGARDCGSGALPEWHVAGARSGRSTSGGAPSTTWWPPFSGLTLSVRV